MNLTGAIGGRPAERSLEKILEEINDPRMASTVLRTIQGFHTALNQIKFIPKYNYRGRFLNMEYRATKSKINSWQYPLHVVTHTLACVSSEYKKSMENLRKEMAENPQELKKSRPDED